MTTRQKHVTLTVSLPLNLAREFDKLAQAEAKSKSQLSRDMFRTYLQRQHEEEFFELQRYMARQARKKGVLTERNVEAIVFRDR